MARTSFNADWWVSPNVSPFAQLNGNEDSRVAVTLPHDAMLSALRSADRGGGASTGYFEGGSVAYTKQFDVPEDWRTKRVTVEFEGAYRDAAVFVNGAYAAQRPSGYTTFRVGLDAYLEYGAQNTVRVETRAHQDSRWYPGLGLHRDVTLIITELAHFSAGGVRVTTPDVNDDVAVVEIVTQVANETVSRKTLEVATRIVDPEGETVASDTAPITLRAGEAADVTQRLYVPNPWRWNVDSPHLYGAFSELGDAARVLDSAHTVFGIRTLTVDPFRGLRINGEALKLRGACIHHDNGILGAASIGRAEERRIEILKAAGFNAIRSSHNPISPRMLDACDRLGMLVMDEAFDMWAEPKTPFDYSLAFPEWWERDIEAMIEKDFNHPSVIIYSIGNEVLDAGKPLGATWGRKLAAKVRSLDETRFITNAVSGFVSTLADVRPILAAHIAGLGDRGGANDVMDEISEVMSMPEVIDLITDRTAESHSVVDIVGHNYDHARYLGDRDRFPNRVVVGTETLSRNIDLIWPLVTANPHVIGDFVWTGWDYLGEAGLGATAYTDDPARDPDPQAFPALLAWSGEIDITGFRRPASYFREIVFGLRTEPYLAVRRPGNEGRHSRALDWAWSDTTSSWTWDVPAGTPMHVEVYSDAEEVELQLNGRTIGTAPAGNSHRFRAEFDLPYSPGELVAVARSGGRETGRSKLRSADGPLQLRVSVDRSDIRADDSDLSFIPIELVDDSGTLSTNGDRAVRVEVDGPARLQGLGSARPVTEEPYTASQHTTFEGRALAVIRPTGAGKITVTVSATGLEPAVVQLRALESTA